MKIDILDELSISNRIFEIRKKIQATLSYLNEIKTKHLEIQAIFSQAFDKNEIGRVEEFNYYIVLAKKKKDYLSLV